MSDNDIAPARHDFEDATTGEHPVLVVPIADDSPTTEVASSEFTQEHEAPAVLGLQRLEGEIARLHDRWREVEHQFSVKDALVAELRDEVGAHVAAAAELERRLAKSVLELKAAEDALVGKHSEVTRLTGELAARGTALADSEAQLAAASAEHETALRDLGAARTEASRLTAELQREHAAAGAATRRSDELAAAQGTLQQRIQELEAYIDGRANSWSSLHEEVAEHKNTIMRLEKSLKTQERVVEEIERGKRAIEGELTELTRRNADLGTQAKDREAAYQNLEHRLEDIRAAHTWLQGDVTRYRTDNQRLLAKASEDRALITTLEAELALHAETVSSGERDLTAARALISELTAAKESLASLLQQQKDVTARLASEVTEKQTSLDLLNRSVRRISDLGASVAELERRFETGSAATKSRNEPPADPEHERDELLPAATFLAAELEEELAINAPPRSGTRKLVGTVGGEAVDYALGKSEVTIGRGKTSDIRIQSHYISRHHARISTRGIATTIEDIGSKNGILVNQEKVKRAVLRDGDVVTLASELEFKFIDARH